MEQYFFVGNRQELYSTLQPGSLLVLFSGHAPRKTADEMYPFFADRSFVYFTGIEQEDTVFLAKIGAESVEETLYLLPPNELEERWQGKRIKPAEAEEISGIRCFRSREQFDGDFRKMVLSGDFDRLCLDIDQLKPEEPFRDALKLAQTAAMHYPFLPVKNIHPAIVKLRTVKKPCEIAAMKQAQEITRAGIMAMMKASRPGMYEYQYKAEWDYTLAQYGVLSPAFPSIISAGKNNFCIHYHAYTGQAQDGDMVLNDVGAIWDRECNDVSRGWPCNGKFTDRQKILYDCAYRTSNHLFKILKPGIPMRDVDRIVHEYCAGLLVDAGVLKRKEDERSLMWHGGAHHVGMDVHDPAEYDGNIRPGYVFCVDVGIYCEEWGIGFRLEDNCHVTENGCENLSAATPRSVEDIEAFMGRR